MKILLFALCTILLIITTPVNGQNTCHQLRIIESISGNDISRYDPVIVEDDAQKLNKLQLSRQLILQRDDVRNLAEGLQQLDMQERSILTKYSSTIKTISPEKLFTKKTSTPNSKTSIINNPDDAEGLMKTPEAGYSKQGMDSLVHYVWENNLWKRKTKSSYKYNVNEQLTSYSGYEMGTTGWIQNERGTYTYNKYGEYTLNLRESLSEYATIWLIDYKESNTYDTNLNLTKTEITGQYFDPSVSSTETYGLERIDYTYNTSGELSGIVYYEWDDSGSTWKNSVKIELTVVNGIETMFANYQWDNTYNNWVGTYKFEHALVPGTSLVNSTYYGWNTSTDNWYVSSKDIYNTGTDINGVNITQTISTANPATYVLLQSSKNIYTKPFKTNVQDLENFILTEGFVWDNTSKTWVNNDKTTREFNSKGLINQSVQQKWVKDATTSVYGWVDASKHLYTYDVFGNRASEILQEKDPATSEWKNISLTEFMYDITSENTGFIQYENDGTGNWKFISRTEHDEDQTGKLLKDMYVYYNENLNKNIINKWEENVYNSAGQLIKHIHDFSTVITWNAATQKFSFSTEGKQEEFSYNNAGKVLNETSSIYDSENERFVYSTKSAYQYHETYPTAITEEITSIWNTSANQWINNSKTDLTYNFSYPQNSLVLPAIIKNNTDGILKYYAYLLQNSVTQVWNATTQTWMNDEKNIMYFTSKTVSEIKPAFSSDINIYPNPTRNFVQINFASTTVRLSLFDLQGRIILQQELTSADNRIDLSGLDAGVYLYEIRNAEGEKQKGKLMIE